MSILEIAENFFWPCDEGKGWEACRKYCHDDATFETEAETLAEVSTLKDYVEWMVEVHTMMKDITFDIKAMAEDTNRDTVLIYAVFNGLIALETSPQPLKTDYVYAITFKKEKISHVAKIWYLKI